MPFHLARGKLNQTYAKALFGRQGLRCIVPSVLGENTCFTRVLAGFDSWQSIDNLLHASYDQGPSVAAALHAKRLQL
jgi:hypothetical protein